MTTYVTTFSRLLTSYSYMIGAIIQKFSKTRIIYGEHCGSGGFGGEGGHC